MTITTGQPRCPTFQRTQLSRFGQETNPRREELLCDSVTDWNLGYTTGQVLSREGNVTRVIVLECV